jgi:enolase
MIADAVEAIRASSFDPGREVAIAVDVASTHFYEDGVYRLGASALTSGEMIAQLDD